MRARMPRRMFTSSRSKPARANILRKRGSSRRGSLRIEEAHVGERARRRGRRAPRSRRAMRPAKRGAFHTSLAERGHAQLVGRDLHRRREVERAVRRIGGDRRDHAAARELLVGQPRHLGAEHEGDVRVAARAPRPRAPPRAPAAPVPRTRAAAPTARRCTRAAGERFVERCDHVRAVAARPWRPRRSAIGLRIREARAARRAPAARGPSSSSRVRSRRRCPGGSGPPARSARAREQRSAVGGVIGRAAAGSRGPGSRAWSA